MSRDHRKLQVFTLADRLIIKVYGETAAFPPEERFGLCSQVRRSAVSVATNIVEGSARRTTRDYLHFINIATGSAAESLYLLDLSSRLGLLSKEVYRELEPKYSHLLRGLQFRSERLRWIDAYRASRGDQTSDRGHHQEQEWPVTVIVSPSRITIFTKSPRVAPRAARTAISRRR